MSHQQLQHLARKCHPVTYIRTHGHREICRRRADGAGDAAPVFVTNPFSSFADCKVKRPVSRYLPVDSKGTLELLACLGGAELVEERQVRDAYGQQVLGNSWPRGHSVTAAFSWHISVGMFLGATSDGSVCSGASSCAKSAKSTARACSFWYTAVIVSVASGGGLLWFARSRLCTVTASNELMPAAAWLGVGPGLSSPKLCAMMAGAVATSLTRWKPSPRQMNPLSS